MPRSARLVIPGVAHHVTQRGVRGTNVFLDDQDRQVYLSLLRKFLGRHEVKIWAYCLMSNHVHFVIVPGNRVALAGFFRDAHADYSKYFNARHGFKGHLWQERYFSRPLKTVHLWSAIRYAEMNPVRAGMVQRSETYPWSSARAHCGLEECDPVLASDCPIPWNPNEWMVWINESTDKVVVPSL